MMKNIISTLFAVLIAFNVQAQPTPKDYSPNDKVIVGYYESWALYRPGAFNLMPQDIPAHLLTHINYSFMGFAISADKKEVQIISLDDYADSIAFPQFDVLKAQYQEQGIDIKVGYAIGGATFGSQRFSEMANDAQLRASFIANAIAFAHANNFDGIDIDWEFPGATWNGQPHPEDYANYVLLVKEFRAALTADKAKGNNELYLTIATGVNPTHYQDQPGSPENWFKALSQYVDWINVMTYDYYGAWNTGAVTGANAPLMEILNPVGEQQYFAIDPTISYMLNKQKIDPNKLVLGIPSYGRNYAGVQSSSKGSVSTGPGKGGFGLGQDGFLSLLEVVLRHDEGYANKEDLKIYRDDAEPAYSYNSTTKEWISYDDEIAVQNKVNYLLNVAGAEQTNGLRGAMVWAIGLDSMVKEYCYPILTTIKVGLHGQALPTTCKYNKPVVEQPPVYSKGDMVFKNNNPVIGSSEEIEFIAVFEDGTERFVKTGFIKAGGIAHIYANAFGDATRVKMKIGIKRPNDKDYQYCLSGYDYAYDNDAPGVYGLRNNDETKCEITQYPPAPDAK